MTTEFTSHFRFGIPDFDVSPWHAILEQTLRDVDDAIYQALLAQSIALWANSHVYVIGDLIVSPETGKIYTCAVAHTSPVAPTTFTTFLNANPTFWNTTVSIPTQRGAWQTNTSYTIGDFVIDSSRYAVCIVSHVSGTFDTDLAAGKWSILIDLTSIGVGINGAAETDVASAATCDIGTSAPTRLRITGATGITSFGTVANTFKIVRYASTPTVTHDGTALILLGAANRTMRAGDIQFLSSDNTGNWRELFFSRADGNPATATEKGVIEIATSAETTALNDTVRAVVPDTLCDALAWLIAAGTAVLFYQSSAPTHWTKVTTTNDCALRLVSGSGGVSGGTVGFATLFARTTTDGYTLTGTDIPASGIVGTSGDDSPDHHHQSNDAGNKGRGGGVTAPNDVWNGGNTGQDSGGASSRHGHGPGTFVVNGGGGAHSHALDMRVKFADCIVAAKDTYPT